MKHTHTSIHTSLVLSRKTVIDRNWLSPLPSQSTMTVTLTHTLLPPSHTPSFQPHTHPPSTLTHTPLPPSHTHPFHPHTHTPSTLILSPQTQPHTHFHTHTHATPLHWHWLSTKISILKTNHHEQNPADTQYHVYARTYVPAKSIIPFEFTNCTTKLHSSSTNSWSNSCSVYQGPPNIRVRIKGNKGEKKVKTLKRNEERKCGGNMDRRGQINIHEN